MNLIFATRVVCAIYLVVFIINLIFGDRVVNWRDWTAGIAFAISIYYLEPPIRNYLSKRKFWRR